MEDTNQEVNTNLLDKDLSRNERNLTVKIVGLALFRLVNKKKENGRKIGDYVEARFPQANDHIFKIVITKKERYSKGKIYTSEFILPSACEINFIPNSENRESEEDISIETNIVSLAKLHSETRIPEKDISSNHAGILAMHGTKIYGEKFGDSKQMDFVVWKVEKSEFEERRRRIDQILPEYANGRMKLGNNLSAGFKVNESDFTIIEVKGGLDYQLKLPYSIEKNGKMIPLEYDITFYNDCDNSKPECRKLGDLHYYYDILESKSVQIEFAMPESIKTQNGGCTPACNC
ncbi:MAG: hypothetical protein MUF43_06200 [Flavobacterium sp.]|nr:hypothetical protein [Pyrinomonadaceae bacterium]MCU0350410.1 hypothetical protein [Flavobacterium sp.]